MIRIELSIRKGCGMQLGATTDWKVIARQIIEDNWQKGRITPLSYLGSELKKRSDVVLPPRLRLLQSIEEIADVAVVRHPSHPLVWGLHPIGAQLDADIERYFAPPVGEFDGRRFQQFIWQAFKNEISGDDVRIVDFGTQESRDVAKNTRPGNADQFVVTRADQLPPAARLDKVKMAAHIQQWLEKIGRVDQGLLSDRTSATASETTSAIGRNLLDLLLTKLSERDLQKLNFPLDIVEKLRKTII